jgi:hypothetical protein
MRRVLPAIGLAAITSATVLGGVAYNRSGAPEASLVLTERELPMGHAGEEDSGASLQIDWNRPLWEDDDEGRIDKTKLEALGFDCSLPLDDPSAALVYGKALAVPRFAVLEHEGEAWARWLLRQERDIETLRAGARGDRGKARELEDRRERLARERLGRSRLFLVDVGRDAGELRRRYPDRSRHLVVAALVELSYRAARKTADGKEEPPSLRGYVLQLPIESIHVPRRWRGPLDAIRREEVQAAEKRRDAPDAGDAPHYRSPYDGPPRYRVTLRYGRRLEPSITDLARLP